MASLRLFPLLFATAVAAHPLAAEELLREGSRVRVSREGGRRTVGVLKSIDHERLLVEDDEDGDLVFVPVAAVKKVEVSRSSSSRPWSERMLIGAGVGLLTGATVGYVGFDAGCKGCDTIVTPIFGVLGAGAGAVVGLAILPSDRWTEVPKHQVRVSVAPLRGGGVGASLSVGF